MINKLTYDCHNKRHSEVESELENWLLMHSSNTPIDIIIGNSDKMKSIVTEVLENHDFKWVIPSYNPGHIIVL